MKRRNFVTALLILPVLLLAGCKVDGDKVANVNSIVADVNRAVATFAEGLVFQQNGGVKPADVNKVLMEPARIAASASQALAKGQLDGGYSVQNLSTQISNGIDAVLNFDSTRFSEKDQANFALARSLAAGAQAALNAARVPDTASALSIKPETRPIVQRTYDTNTSVIARIGQWQMFYGVK